MATILINGINSKSAGGKSILNNYLSLLSSSYQKHNYLILCPSRTDYLKYENESIHILNSHKIISNALLAPIIYRVYLDKLLHDNSVDLVFNMGDLIIHTSTPQVYLFDWAFAVYQDHEIWGMMDWKSKLNRKIKLLLFKQAINKVATVIAQTGIIKDKLVEQYNLNNVHVIENAVSLDNFEDETNFDWRLPKSKNLLYLTHYYPHKNLEILLPLAVVIKEKGLDYKLILTIDPEQHPKAKELLDKVKELGLNDIIINVGSVSMALVPSLYKQCDALLMPTLLESFSGTYVEALFHKIPIFTTNADFSKAVCKNAAFYFDPHDENSILKQLEYAFEVSSRINEKINVGSQILNDLPSWEVVYEQFQNIINNRLEHQTNE
jgi:glycosyltransferase involved in cell wall biosynthesis